MLTTVQKRVLLAYAGVFAVATSLLPLMKFLALADDVTLVVIETVVWTMFYAIGVIAVIRSAGEPFTANAAVRLIASIVVADAIVLMAPWSVVVDWGSYAVGLGGVLLLDVLGNVLRIFIMCASLLLVIAATTKRLSSSGRIVIVRGVFLIIAAAMVGTAGDLGIFILRMDIPDAADILNIAKVSLSAITFAVPCYYLMHAYLTAPTDGGGIS